MFQVAERQWKVSMEPNRAKGRWEDPDSGSDYQPSDNEGEEPVDQRVGDPEHKPSPSKKGRWICEVPSSEAKTVSNVNKHITDQLEELLRVYRNDQGDKWRAMQTQKAISSLRKHHTEITTYEVLIIP